MHKAIGNLVLYRVRILMIKNQTKNEQQMHEQIKGKVGSDRVNCEVKALDIWEAGRIRISSVIHSICGLLVHSLNFVLVAVAAVVVVSDNSSVRLV